MRFGARNAYYLRISPNVVLPLYLYLDERHIDWMSERVLQHVLSDLRPLIPVKLEAEKDAHVGPGGSANAKKGTMDVHRGETYQFGYWLGKIEHHAIVMKTRHFVPAPNPPPSQAVASQHSDVITAPARRKRPPKNAATGRTGNKKRRTKGKGKVVALDEDEPIAISSDDDMNRDSVMENEIAAAPRRSARAKKLVAGGYRDEDENEGTVDTSPNTINEAGPMASEQAGRDTSGAEPDEPSFNDPGLLRLDSEAPSVVAVKEEGIEPILNPQAIIPSAEEEAQEGITSAPSAIDIPADISMDDGEDYKAKLQLRLHYQGLAVYERCLCVIVEPYPKIRAASRALSLAPQGIIAPRAPSIAPADFITTAERQRARTPLFLPDDDRERSATPAPIVPRRSLPPVPLFHEEPREDDDDESDDEYGGMMQFSQILRTVGEYQGDTGDVDDDVEGAVFFGDADEMKEL